MSVARADFVDKPSLTLKRRLNAPAEKVYAAWTDPQKIVKWFGPDAGPVTKAEIDLRVGGTYTIAFNTEDGEHHQVGGIYREVVPNERLVFTWAWHTMKERESQVTITIDPHPVAREIRRRSRPRRSSARLGRLARQARTTVRLKGRSTR